MLVFVTINFQDRLFHFDTAQFESTAHRPPRRQTDLAAVGLLLRGERNGKINFNVLYCIFHLHSVDRMQPFTRPVCEDLNSLRR
jgi:hypothetical protein